MWASDWLGMKQRLQTNLILTSVNDMLSPQNGNYQTLNFQTREIDEKMIGVHRAVEIKIMQFTKVLCKVVIPSNLI